MKTGKSKILKMGKWCRYVIVGKWKYTVRHYTIQGDPNQNPSFQRAINLKFCVSDLSDLKLLNPNCVWKAVVFLWKIVNKSLKNKKKNTASLPKFGFPNNISSWMHSFRGICISIWFWSLRIFSQNPVESFQFNDNILQCIT